MKLVTRIAIAVVVVSALVASGVYFGMTGSFASVNAAVEIGEKMPGFTLSDQSGKTHTLSDYAGKIVVLEFCSQQCPFSRGADPHLSELAKSYADKGVVFLGVDSHHQTTPDEIAAYVKETGKPYPILKDVGNAYADAVGARVTPEIYIVSPEGNLAYHGAFDNRSAPAQKGGKAYTADALKALAEGQPVETTTAKAWGCSIKRK